MPDLALAIDLGGTKIEAALVTDTGEVVPGSRARRPTGADVDAERLAAAVAEASTGAIAALPAESRIVGVGIGSAGPIDLARGTIFPVNMPGVHGFALADAGRAAASAAGLGDIVVRLRHDGGCLALAESWIGAARGARASLSIVVSTGVGGGLVIGGVPIGGASGNAGHLGQTRGFDPGTGAAAPTLEEVASGPASTAWARAQGWAGESGEDLGRSAASGDPLARAAIERSATAVGRALADAATLLDLDVVAIGGGFSHVSDDYIDLVAASLRAHAVLPYARAVRVVASALAGEGPLIGAGALIVGPGAAG